MRKVIILAFCLLLAWPAMSLAEVVGRLTQVEGRVELLKAGNLPAVEAKAQDGVETGDVIRTKSLSRAQITFLDNTTLTISPEARIAVEEYMFDPAKGKRSAVMQLFQGLAHFVVSQVYKVQEPDFIVKTHTGVLGVRGTDVGIRLSANDTTFLCFKGLVRVANIFPEVSGIFSRAEKTAFAFGSGSVDLNSMQGSVVARGLPPTLPFTITNQDRELFNRQLSNGLLGRSASDGATGGPPSGLAGNLPDAVRPAYINPLYTSLNLITIPQRLASSLPDEVSPVFTNRINTILNNITIPPQLVSTAPLFSAGPSVPPDSFTFSQIISGGNFSFSALSPSFNSGTFSGGFSGFREVAYPGPFSASFSFAATLTRGTFIPISDGGSFIVGSNSFQVSGPHGGTLTGTGTMQATATGSGSTSFTLSGPVSITPSGALTFTPTGTFTNSAGPGNVTGGSVIQQTPFTGTGTIAAVSAGPGTATFTSTGGSGTVTGGRVVPGFH